VAAQAFKVRGGALLPLIRPGLGIEVDEERLAKYRCS
jgi:L-alanine-DL-glutamate epimerase-like enolase superfamily enzyme